MPINQKLIINQNSKVDDQFFVWKLHIIPKEKEKNKLF
jgi:hypothetical protein